MNKFYSLDEILKYDSQYYIIYGCRSAGKSYAVTRRAIDRFFKYGEEFIIIKRLESQITNRIAGTMLSDHYKYIEETYNKKVRFYSGKWWVYDKDKEGKLSECEIMGYALSLSTVEKSKGSQFPKVETIIFEEFMSIDCKYLNNEINLLLNLVSTVFRHRTTGKIFMLGNSISKYNIYSELLGVHLHKLQKNQIIQKSFRDENGTVTKFTLQRTENVNVEENNRNRDKVVYTNFGKHIDKMINEGKFSSREHNLYKNVVTFQENIKKIPKGNWITFGNKKDSTNFLVEYMECIYKIYRKDIGDISIYGFKEIDFNKERNKNEIYYIFNGTFIDSKIINISNVSYFYSKNEKINEMITDISRAILSNNIVFTDDETGEDILTAFKLIGLDVN